MPSWNIHLEVGERINQKLKFKGQKKEEFLLGCILPDINNGYINKVRIRKEHGETHWAFNQKSSLNFYAKYQKEIEKKEPVFLGYLVHLYTDGFFNYDFYRKAKHSKISELSHTEQRDIKHNDFWKYDLNFEDLEFRVSDKKAAAKAANKIEGVDVDEAEIAEVEEILKNKDMNNESRKRKYQFYTKAELDEVMDEMIKSFTGDYL